MSISQHVAPKFLCFCGITKCLRRAWEIDTQKRDAEMQSVERETDRTRELTKEPRRDRERDGEGEGETDRDRDREGYGTEWMRNKESGSTLVGQKCGWVRNLTSLGIVPVSEERTLHPGRDNKLEIWGALSTSFSLKNSYLQISLQCGFGWLGEGLVPLSKQLGMFDLHVSAAQGGLFELPRWVNPHGATRTYLKLKSPQRQSRQKCI